ASYVAIKLLMFLQCIFFFQAEDGIRDGHVTGVQTCALPILVLSSRVLLPCAFTGLEDSTMRIATLRQAITGTRRARLSSLCIERSEERRVGKECRYRWLTDSSW